MAINKEFYNEASALKLGWDPSWFGVATFDERLTSAIRKWQKENGLMADGLAGPTTFRRIWTQREAAISTYINFCSPEKEDSLIIHNGKPYEINWSRVVLWDEKEGLSCKKGHYTSFAGEEDRKPQVFVNHWDVCLNSKSCANVLDRRGISVHFCIDNDGTIYQLLDTQHGAWHAGNRKVNLRAIGVEISNAYYLKYQSWYVKNGFGERPIMNDEWIHGKKMKPFLGFYPVQIEALKALWESIANIHNIPLQAPKSGNNSFQTSTTIERETTTSRYSGFISHYHLTRKKIDCAGLDIVKLINQLKNKELS